MAYGHGLMERTRIIVFNKKELLKEATKKEILKNFKFSDDQEYLFISAVMSDGLDDLLKIVWKNLGV